MVPPGGYQASGSNGMSSSFGGSVTGGSVYVGNGADRFGVGGGGIGSSNYATDVGAGRAGGGAYFGGGGGSSVYANGIGSATTSAIIGGGGSYNALGVGNGSPSIAPANTWGGGGGQYPISGYGTMEAIPAFGSQAPNFPSQTPFLVAPAATLVSSPQLASPDAALWVEKTPTSPASTPTMITTGSQHSGQSFEVPLAIAPVTNAAASMPTVVPVMSPQDAGASGADGSGAAGGDWVEQEAIGSVPQSPAEVTAELTAKAVSNASARNGGDARGDVVDGGSIVAEAGNESPQASHRTNSSSTQTLIGTLVDSTVASVASSAGKLLQAEVSGLKDGVAALKGVVKSLLDSRPADTTEKAVQSIRDFGDSPNQLLTELQQAEGAVMVGAPKEHVMQRLSDLEGTTQHFKKQANVLQEQASAYARFYEGMGSAITSLLSAVGASK
eukprot:TRINITY_DN24942_c0_g1_i1.p1 TRINITY_DN24942_c0_g1~~TRINITY_DN24942_c0_g1_i1.p1  ORF type:complete len:507 (+),score=121.92 TRINITY_DN24942_c0_g1_i1:197-1522(+)